MIQTISYLALCGLDGDVCRFRQLQFWFKTAVLNTAVLRHLARLRLTLAPVSKGEVSRACDWPSIRRRLNIHRITKVI